MSLISFIRKALNPKKISSSDVKYIGVTTLDNLGKTFEYEGSIYRGIYKDQEGFVKKLFEIGLINELVLSGHFIATEITDYSMDEFSLILKHKKITPTQPTEWTFSMHKDACKAILEVNKICNKYGYELWDAHPYNISFDGSRAVWIDFGSISVKNDSWRAKDEFIFYCLLPLVFLQNNDQLAAYSYLLSEKYVKTVTNDLNTSIFFNQFLTYINEDYKSYQQKNFDLDWIDKNVGEIKKDDSFWKGYQIAEEAFKNDIVPHKGNRFNRFFRIIELMKQFSSDATSLVDLAGNCGLAALISKKHLPNIKKSINTDYDYNSIEDSFQVIKKEKYPIETYLLNFMLPMDENIATILKSDIVLALAVTHHLTLTQKFKIDGIFRKIKEYSNKYVYIEFMPLGMWGGDTNSKPEVPEWYTENWFEEKFKDHFKLIHKETIESHEINGIEEAHRVIFIGEIK